nr:uncharacterized protein LOC106690088 [Halyomorpha halys]
MWEEREGRKVFRVNEVDVLVGVIIGLGGDKGVTKRKLRRAICWMTPLQLQLTLSRGIARGLLKEVGTRYVVRMEEAVVDHCIKPKYSSQMPPETKTLKDVHDIYATNF